MWLTMIHNPSYAYTSIHGDHRIYYKSGTHNDTCYGTVFDPCIVERMVRDGLITAASVDIARVAELSNL